MKRSSDNILDGVNLKNGRVKNAPALDLKFLR
jgi:hypothetical protein